MTKHYTNFRGLKKNITDALIYFYPLFRVGSQVTNKRQGLWM